VVGEPHLTQRPHCWSWWNLPELAIAFACGLALMQYVYSITPDGDAPANVPGNDSFYHVKMAMMLPQLGLPQEFPWLKHTIFERGFVSHHYGFHVWLYPFVTAFSHPLIGARWAMSVSFGLVLAVAMLILISEGVAFRWFWLALLLTLSTEFYVRHAYIRAIDLSLLCILLGTLCLFRRRYVWLAAVMVLYTHVYLGAFFLGIVGLIHYVSGWLGPRRALDVWRLPAALAIGGVLGLVTHPYSTRVIGFLWTQIFGSGLTPEVSVGREWSSHEGVWSYANLVGIPFSAMAIAAVLRLRMGPRLDRNTWTMLAASLFFLVLNLKARRFVEYFPFFAALAAAMMSKPILQGRGADRPRAETAEANLLHLEWAWLAVALALAVGAWANYRFTGGEARKSWLILAAACAGAYVAYLAVLDALRNRPAAGTWAIRLAATALTAAALVGVMARVSAPIHDKVRSWAAGKYDLAAVQAAMTFLMERSNPGDVVFTDDWDVFTIYFYFNDKNRYVCGLDPMFSYTHDAELWERYRMITQGRTPVTKEFRLPAIDERGRKVWADRTITVELSDIRDRFGAGFVIVDKDHQPFSRKLDRDKDGFRRIYPLDADGKVVDGDLMIYEVLPADAKAQGKRMTDVP